MVPSPSSKEGDMDMDVDIVLEQGSASMATHSQNKPAALQESNVAADTRLYQGQSSRVSPPSNRHPSQTEARRSSSDAAGRKDRLGLNSPEDTPTISVSHGTIRDTPSSSQNSSSGALILTRGSKKDVSIVIEIPPWTGPKRRVIPLQEDTIPTLRSKPKSRMLDNGTGSKDGSLGQSLPRHRESLGNHGNRARLRQVSLSGKSRFTKLPASERNNARKMRRAKDERETAPQAADPADHGTTVDSVYQEISEDSAGEEASTVQMGNESVLASSDMSDESTANCHFEDHRTVDSDSSFHVPDNDAPSEPRSMAPKSPSSIVPTLGQSRHSTSARSNPKTKALVQLARNDNAPSSASEEWVEEIMQYDNIRKRFHYAHTNVDKLLGDFNKMVLEAAYQSYGGRIKDLKEEDIEFIAVVARCTASAAKKWLDSRSTTQTSAKNLGTKVSKTPKKKATPLLSMYNSPTFEGHIKNYKRASNGDFKPVVRIHIEESHRALQEEACSTYKVVKGLELCRSCAATQAGDMCRMAGFRFFYVEDLQNKNIIDKLSFGPDFLSDPAPDKSIQFDMPGMPRAHLEYVLACLSSKSRALLEQQIIPVDATEDYIHRPDTRRQFCEYCRRAIVSNYYMCSACGLGLCPGCYSDGTELLVCTHRRMHVDRQFELCGRFHRSTLRWYLKVYDQVMSNVSQQVLPDKELSALSRPEASEEKPAPLYLSSDVKLEEFQARWAAGNVIVILNVGGRLKQKGWSLEGLLNITKEEDTALVMKNCSTQMVESTTMHEFLLRNFTTPGTCRLMEWPSEPFEKRCKALHDDLMHALPLPDYTSPMGRFNLSRYFPQGHKSLGLGFKMYPCQGLGRKEASFGTFPLNCELADKIYICTYTQAIELGDAVSPSQLRELDDSTAVVWDIFRPEDRPELAHFIATVLKPYDNADDQDPFSCEQFFFNMRSLRQLDTRHNVRPYRVYQRAGEAVMIPAGSVRQARYVVDTILTGLDFVSPETMPSTLEWYTESRKYSLLPGKIPQPDPIQAFSILLYTTLAFMSAIMQCDSTSSSSSSTPPKSIVSTSAFKGME
ncbi:hypothetical protein EMPS_04275 [Entomortierella parvispora]|uniref:JmjC domain-containing protein n=1 Tax=Entomortierella parvispora TaxID=205924 RepID=A0A9P3LVB7_9FUNG|nr:hypothetical protein EMPS_04275 [Entomortierella parvispora]